MKRRIDRITQKLQVLAIEIHRINCCYFVDCQNTKEVLFKLGAKYWVAIMESEGYSERYCNSSVCRFTNRFLNYFNKVAKNWDDLNGELTNKLIRKPIK